MSGSGSTIARVSWSRICGGRCHHQQVAVDVVAGRAGEEGAGAHQVLRHAPVPERGAGGDLHRDNTHRLSLMESSPTQPRHLLTRVGLRDADAARCPARPACPLPPPRCPAAAAAPLLTARCRSAAAPSPLPPPAPRSTSATAQRRTIKFNCQNRPAGVRAGGRAGGRAGVPSC